MSNQVAVEFEVFGKVQGVFFRKYTQKKAQQLGLAGYVENTPRGTVIGKIEGDRVKVNTMKTWLEKSGSPKSKIERAVFTIEKAVTAPSLGFNIIR